MCALLSVFVTHIRYEEGKETQVGDGDRELSRLPVTSREHRKAERELPNLPGV